MHVRSTVLYVDLRLPLACLTSFTRCSGDHEFFRRPSGWRQAAASDIEYIPDNSVGVDLCARNFERLRFASDVDNMQQKYE